MKVFKFGGASVKDADSVRNVAKIIQAHQTNSIVVVVSAMGKMTNAFEELLKSFYFKKDDVSSRLGAIKKFHFDIVGALFPDPNHTVYNELHNTFVEAEWQLEDNPIGSFDFEYDQLVGLGELLSTKIVAAYLKEIGINNQWLDARDVIKTDNNYRKAQVDWDLTTQEICQKIKTSDTNEVWLTQGFIGSSSENFSTTLGREGSDFSASIFAKALGASEVVIWKDVAGMLNADPKYYAETVKLDNISYKEAVELAYYGASVIHPKTIKPLQNSQIPLYVKSFIHPEDPGSVINDNPILDRVVPSYIHKPKQLLISISSKDYAFMTEQRLSAIFWIFSDKKLSINIMQNSAISFSVCIDHDEEKVEGLMEKLRKEFNVTYNFPTTLITIRHYTEEIIDQLIGKKKVLLEQRTRSTARVVLDD